MRHVLAVLVENNPGVLARVAALIRRRGFNIESLAVGPTEDRRISRMTLAVEGDDAIVEQVEKQLNKLVEVLKVSDLDAENSVTRELALVKVHADPSRRAQILQLADIFRARVVDSTIESFVFEMTGSPGKLDAFINLMQPLGLVDVSRTGIVAIARGPEAL